MDENSSEPFVIHAVHSCHQHESETCQVLDIATTIKPTFNLDSNAVRRTARDVTCRDFHFHSIRISFLIANATPPDHSVTRTYELCREENFSFILRNVIMSWLKMGNGDPASKDEIQFIT
jgi:hypothetical protein